MLFSNLTYAGPLDAVINPGKLYKGHAKIEKDCKSCHKPFNKSEQKKLCANCHDHKDIARDILKRRGFHGRIAKQDCKTCHPDHKGRNAKIIHLDKRRFDHSKTDFVLRGKHKGRKITCAKCHKKGKKYRDAPIACLSCHRKKDVHKGSLGKKCADCHTALDWKKVRFDHKKTDYPLIGKHRDVSCRDCHKTKDHKNTPKTCRACHKKDDDHRGKFGSKCKSCHTPRDWTISLFKHGRVTKYRLRGAHKKIKCTACHKGNLFKEKLKTTCYACHRGDDVHKGQEGKQCKQCHNEWRWTKTRFDHGQAQFPLLGKHTRVKCKKCHEKQTFKDAPTTCYACHKKEDEHKRRLGTSCELCHNARGWDYWRFNHNRQTDFKLDGSHKGLQCEACHTRPSGKSVSTSSQCNSCHEDDDVHDGKFGVYCERCHVTRNFTRIKNIPGMH